MIIIELMPGLGNQMFQYALYLRFQDMGKQVALTKTYTVEEVLDNHDNEVFDVYDVHCRFATEDELERLRRKSKSLAFYLKKKFGKIEGLYIEEKPYYGEYHDGFFKYEDAILSGYWQTEKYFLPIKETIRTRFIPKKELNPECKKMMKLISENDTSVSVHVRLGDYLEPQNQVLYKDICTKEYYHRAFDYMKKYIVNPVFYVFSNDLKKAQDLFVEEDVVLVCCNTIDEGWADMYLMSLCRNNIIANSTFSWWGAYLNKNANKIIIAPSKWINTYSMPDICPEEWIRI